LQLKWSAAVVRTDPAMAKLIAQREMMVSAAPEALDIALRHQLISEQTSMIIVHERDAANMALGVPTAVSVEHMNSSYMARSESVSAGAPRFAKEDTTSFALDQPALWRLPSKDAIQSRLDVLNDLDFEVPAHLTRDHDESTAERLGRRIRNFLRSRGDGAKKNSNIQIAESDLSVQQPEYTSPSEVLQGLSKLAESAPYSAETLRAFLKSLTIPEHIKSEAEEALSHGDGLATGVIFLVLSDVIGSQRQCLTARAERWVMAGLLNCQDQDYVHRLAKRSRSVFRGATPQQWGPDN